eukprot:tig00000215_g18630.t1
MGQLTGLRVLKSSKHRSCRSSFQACLGDRLACARSSAALAATPDYSHGLLLDHSITLVFFIIVIVEFRFRQLYKRVQPGVKQGVRHRRHKEIWYPRSLMSFFAPSLTSPYGFRAFETTTASLATTTARVASHPFRLSRRLALHHRLLRASEVSAASSPRPRTRGVHIACFIGSPAAPAAR